MKKVTLHMPGLPLLTTEMKAADADELLEAFEQGASGTFTWQHGGCQYIVRRSAVAIVEIQNGKETQA